MIKLHVVIILFEWRENMISEFYTPIRTIMTPGPVEAHPSVLRKMATPTIGQFDPYFLKIMDDVKEMIKVPFQTKNEQAFAVDGTSRAGLEAALIGLIEAGDKVLIPCYGRFSYLLGEIAERAKAEVIYLEKDWYEPFQQEEIIEAIQKHQPKIVALVHGETANGQMQAINKVGKFCREQDIFFVVDFVATYGGILLAIDDWCVDVAIAGTQKCVSVPSGLALVTYNDRVEQVLTARYQKELGLSKDVRNDNHIASNYLDLSQLQRYWGKERINHHTEATSMVYGLHEGLRLLINEGIEAVWDRHALNNRAIEAGIQAMGLAIYGNPKTKMATVTSIMVPEGINCDAVRTMLLNEFGVEIAGSFGSLAGKVWRIGNMGFSSRKENVLHVLGAFEATLLFHGANINPGAAVQAALKVYL